MAEKHGSYGHGRKISEALQDRALLRERNSRLCQAYPISSITRDDIAKALEDDGMAAEKAQARALDLSEAEMRHFASKINDALCDSLFWDCIREYLAVSGRAIE